MRECSNICTCIYLGLAMVDMAGVTPSGRRLARATGETGRVARGILPLLVMSWLGGSSGPGGQGGLGDPGGQRHFGHFGGKAVRWPSSIWPISSWPLE